MSSKSDPTEGNLARILGVGGAFHGLAVLFVALRVYTRLFVVRSFGKDDAMMVVTIIVLFGGAMVTQIIAGQHGMGMHKANISREDYKIYLMMGFIQAMCCTIASICFLKFSIALSLLRLADDAGRSWYRRAIWALVVFVLCYMIEGWVTILIWCDTVLGQWDPDLKPKPICRPLSYMTLFGLINTGCNIFTDVAFATLPVPLIWGLQMKYRARMYLIGILSLGYIAVCIGVVKAVCQVVYRDDPDKPFNNWIQFWGFHQQNIGVICACAPSLRPLVGKALGVTSDSERSYDKNASGQGDRSRKDYIRSNNNGDNFELNTQQPSTSILDLGQGKDYDANIQATRVDWDNGSEEMLFRNEAKRGAVKTTVTQVDVHS